MHAHGPILILYASAGAGHMIAARGLEQALRRQRPDADSEVCDVLEISNVFFRRLYAGGYSGLVRHAPAAMGWLYDAMDRPDGRVQNAIRVWIQNFNKLPIVRYIAQKKPQLIINTHYLSAEIIAQMRRAGELTCPQVVVTTDLETHRIWVQEPTERYYAATDDGKAYLTTWGVDANRIQVTGIPVRPGFNQSLAREEARRRCRLDPQQPVVLLLTSGFGSHLVTELVDQLLTTHEVAQLAVIVGRNEHLRARLARQVHRAMRSVQIIGFTDRMHEWMRAADLVVTKPGGLTSSEALACALPLVIMNPIPGQETRNSDLLLERGAAIKVNNVRLLGYRVNRLLANPDRLATLRAAAGSLGQPDAADRIISDALSLTETPAV